MTAIEALIQGDRKEMSNLFGVGLAITAKDTPESVIKKCEDYVARYEGYIANIKQVIDDKEQLAEAIKKNRVAAYVRGLSEEEQKDLQQYLNEKF